MAEQETKLTVAPFSLPGRRFDEGKEVYVRGKNNDFKNW